MDEMKNPIPFVDVVVLGNLTTFWQTDLNGKIPERISKRVANQDTLIFHHISYQEKRICKADIKSNDTIYLLQNAYKLKEIELTSKSFKYQKIKACYRSLVVQDNIPLYYSDGKLDYLTKIKKIKYKLFRYDYRTFKHQDIAKYDVNYSVQYGLAPAHTPWPLKKYLPYYMIKKHDLLLEKSDSFTTLILTEDSLPIGELKERDNLIEYRINNIFLFKYKKLLKTEVNLSDFHIYMVFRKPGTKSNYLFNNYNQLLYCSQRYNYTLKHDLDKEPRVIDRTSEIFVEDISFLEEVEEDREYTNAYGMPRYSKFKTDFWKECDCELYYLQNETIFEDMRLK